MAERAGARHNKLWMNIVLGSLLVGALGSASTWVFRTHLSSGDMHGSDVQASAPESQLPKWGRIVPVSETQVPTADAKSSSAKSTLSVAVELPPPRKTSATAHKPQSTSSSVTSMPVNPARSTPTAQQTTTLAVAVAPEPMELPRSVGAHIARPPVAQPGNTSEQAQATTSAPSDELALLDAPVKFPQRENQVATPSRLKLQFGPGSTNRVHKPTAKPLQVKVKRGDSLYGILKSKGLPEAVLPALLSVDEHGDRLKRIRPGQALELYLDAKGRLERLDYRPDALTTVSYRRDGNGFASALKETPLDTHERSVSAVIESSLFLDGQRAGLSNRVIMQMAEIFGWDVDFALDLRDGDRFTVIYEELHKDGRKFRDGDILAAEFINRGRVFRAVRFVTPAGRTEYYTPQGRSMRKAFLRTPVRFARISSRFNLRRKHPVLHKVRAHRGVDYAAPTGTPIKATGAGRIEFLGRKGGYGKTIIIRHTGGKYTTLYAHMHRYGKKLRTGSAVKQGQTIGYVGKTGLATGPHLHYEFRVRGRHKDPLKVRLPKSLPIASTHKRAFQRQIRKFIARLNSSGATVAQND